MHLVEELIITKKKFGIFLEGKCGDYALSGRIDYYEKEIWYLKGQLSTINLIEKGCFVEVVNEGVEAYV